MSTIDLMLLGALMRKPMNAYELKKDMERKSVQNWIKISSPSIYKNFLKLYERGYADAEVVREGEMPEKTVYSINDKGRGYFFSLMDRYSADPGQIYINFCAFIANLENVDRETGLRMLGNLREHLDGAKERSRVTLESRSDVPLPGSAVIELYARMFETFCGWAEDFMARYAENTKSG